MAESTVVRTRRDFVFVIQDSGAAHSYTPPVQVGDFAYQAPLYDLVRILDNSDLYGVRKGDSQPVSLSFTSNLTDIGSGTDETLPDICEERGVIASTWTSTTANESDVPTYDLVGTMDGTAFGEADKSVGFVDMVFRGSAQFGLPATYSVTAESATATKPTVA